MALQVPTSGILYFFRHVQHDQCIVSPTYVLRAIHMAQTGNPHTPVRHDKWIPFLVATNLPKGKGKGTAHGLKVFSTQLMDGTYSLTHGEKVRTPQYRAPDDTDVLQPRAKLLSKRLCEILHKSESFFNPKDLKENAAAGNKGEAAEASTDSSEPLTLLWERMGDRELVLNGTDLVWPDWVRHEQLILDRGRFPKNVPNPPTFPLRKAAKPKKMERQKAIWEVADALSGKKAYKRPY